MGARELLEALNEEETAVPEGASASKAQEQAAYTRRAAMLKAVSLSAHAAVLKDLATVYKTFIALEREAFNVDDGKDDDPDRAATATTQFDALLTKIRAAPKQRVAAG